MTSSASVAKAARHGGRGHVQDAEAVENGGCAGRCSTISSACLARCSKCSVSRSFGSAHTSSRRFWEVAPRFKAMRGHIALQLRKVSRVQHFVRKGGGATGHAFGFTAPLLRKSCRNPAGIPPDPGLRPRRAQTWPHDTRIAEILGSPPTTAPYGSQSITA